MTCVILEDQLPAQRLLTSYLDQVDNLELAATFIDPLAAREYLLRERADVLFLDVHLPRLSGLDLLGSLPVPPQVIITTAFAEYALRGYDFAVVDYLLKPFSFERFRQAVARLSFRPTPAADPGVLFVRDGHAIRRVTETEVRFVIARGDFVQLQLADGRIAANTSLTQLSEELGDNFVRCHKSYLVNLRLIDRILANKVVVAEYEIPVGRKYRVEFLRRLRLV
ncbi:MAG: LytTR family DNA-binding domain-containing protein [Bacteroidota bacterium]